jgi:hexosaminidase
MDLAWGTRKNLVLSSLYIPFYMDYPQNAEEPHFNWMTVQTEEMMYDGEPAAHMERELGDRLQGIESPLWTEMVPEWRVKAKFLPRAIAIAEVGWTKHELRDYLDYRRRRLSLEATGYTW